MRKNVLIVEDNKVYRETLTKIVSECDPVSNIYCTENTEKAYKIAMEMRIDLFLLDIILDNVPGDMSGMIFANNIRGVKKYQFVPVIFITKLEDQKLDAYENLHCYKYIEKPFDKEKTKEIIRGALEYPVMDENSNRFFNYRKDGIIYSIDTNDIICAEYKNRYMRLVMKNDVVDVPYLTCNDLIKRLNNIYFIKCNRNTIVNRKYIDYVDGTNRYICLKNDNIVEIGSIMKKRVLKELDYGT